MSTRRLTAMRIMHRIAAKLLTVFSRTFAASREPAVIALPIIEPMVYMPVKTIRPMEPGPGAQEYSAREPFRAIIAVRSAIIGRNLIVPVRAYGRFADAYRNLCRRLGSRREQKTRRDRHQT